jgi:hypothetical protein
MDDTITITSVGGGYDALSATTITLPQKSISEILDDWELNQFIVEHKVQEQELLKLKEIDVNYADAIKQNLTKSATDAIGKKMSFTKFKDLNMDTTSFRGRIWVFTKEELEQLIKDARNA